ncbi:matrixin family metalloprotease [Prochlorococcus sp. MIT 1201]|uniref:matrixin family metalloprotease n=1 Tax=Prochlorococcus sp. MIT 1201 TaxID=3082535 RepID=UPI0039A6202F
MAVDTLNAEITNRNLAGNSDEVSNRDRLSLALALAYNPSDWQILNSDTTWDDDPNTTKADNPYISGLMHGVKWATTSDPSVDSDTHQFKYYFAQEGDQIKYTSIKDGSPTEDTILALNPNNAEKNAAISAMNTYASIGNIHFSKTQNLEESDISWIFVTDEEATKVTGLENTLGFAWMPGGLNSGQTSINSEINLGSNADAQQPGSYYYLTYIHELGHTLGLKHPHEEFTYNETTYPTFPGVEHDSPNQGGDNGLNATPWTVMTYNTLNANDYSPSYNVRYTSSNDAVYDGFMTGLGAFDIAAIQYLYGPNDTHSPGDDTYPLDHELNGFKSIWDSSGIDTIDGSGSSSSVTIDLRNATLANSDGGGGFISQVNGEFKGYTIAYNSIQDDLNADVIIENATGSDHSDSLRGNSSNNKLDGLAGFDTARFSGPKDEYQLSLNSNTEGFEVADNILSRDGTDQLFNIERINFNGATYDFPTDISISSTSFAEKLAPGTTIATFSATDPDSTNGFLFSLAPGAGSEDNSFFGINEDQLIINDSADYQQKNLYSLRLKAADNDGLEIAKSFALNVIDIKEAPTDITLSATSFNENLAPGTAIADISAIDPDSSNGHIFSLIPGAGSDDNSFFSINEKQLISNYSADYENKTNYSITLEAADTDGMTFAKSFTLNVNDVEETYLTNSVEQIEEGNLLTTTAHTKHIDTGTELYWALYGEGINKLDFLNNKITGSGITDAEGKFSFTSEIRNDQTKEGPETLEIKLFSDDLRSDQVGNTASVEIKDTSRSREYVSRGDSAYVIVDGPTWEEAEANAQSIGGHLASINSEEENDLITALLGNYNIYNSAFIGFKDGQWVDGSDITFNNFHPAIKADPTSYFQQYKYAEIWAPSAEGIAEDWQVNVKAGVWNTALDKQGERNQKGIAEISLTRSNQNIANQWAPNPQATADSDLELGYSLHSINGTDTQTDLKQLAVLGDSVDWQDTYRLDITAKSLAEGYDLETADITINFDPYLFNEIKASDITIGGQLPIANAVRIDNDVGTIRIAAASLGDLDPGDLYGNHIADAGSRIGADGAVLASIDLDFNEFRLDTLTQNSDGSIDDPSTPLFFGLSANQDETVFSKDLTDAAGLSNREIKSLRDLGGDLAVEGTKVTLYEATINLEEQGDGLILSSDLDIGSYNSKQTNLVRSGDTITATSEWTNVGNIKATDIAITGVANDNASLTSSGFYISSPDDSQTSTNLESGSFVDGAFVQAGQETAQLVADIEITGAAGNVVDLSQGILSLKATGSDVFENQKGSKNLITFQGDLNYDGRVSMKDLAYLNAGAARQQQASEDPDAVDANNDGFVDASVARGVDANFDGQISMADLAVLDADWGQSLHQAANGTESSFTGSDQISWDQLDSQGLTGEATWDNQAFKDQNAVEAGNDFVESLESPAAVGVIGADGNETANDGGINGDYFQDPPLSA